MENMNQKPARNTAALHQLLLHFGGKHFPNQYETLFRIATTIIAKQPQSPQSLVQAFTNGKYLPAAVRIQLEEATLLLTQGEQEGYFIRESNGNTYRLSPKSVAQLQQRQTEAARLFAAIRNDFNAHLVAMGYFESAAVTDYLWQCLQKYTKRLAINLMEAASTQTPGSDPTVLLQEILRNPPAHVAGRNVLEIACATFPSFSNTTVNGKNLFCMVFSSVMYAYRTTVTESTSQELQKELANYTLVLDTNLIVTLLGLRNNPALSKANVESLRTLHNHGVRIAVTNSTQNELKAALHAAVRNVRHNRGVIGKYPGDPYAKHSIEMAFYKIGSGVNDTDFITHYSSVQERLGELFDNKIEFIHFPPEKEQDVLHSAVAQEIAQFVSTSNRTYDMVSHDTFHLAYVLRERERNPRKTFWFLTEHTRLTQLFRLHSTSVHKPLATKLEWLFIQFQQLIPRVFDFKEFLSAFVAHEIFYPFMLTRAEVAARQVFYEAALHQHPAAIVAQVFADTPDQVMRRIIKQYSLETGSQDAVDELFTEHERREHARAEHRAHTNRHDSALQGVVHIPPGSDRTAELLTRIRATSETRSATLAEHAREVIELEKLENRAKHRKNLTVYVAACCTMAAIALPFVASPWVVLATAFSATAVLVGTVLRNFIGHHYDTAIAAKTRNTNELAQKLERLSAQEAQDLQELGTMASSFPAPSEDALR